MSLRDLIGNEWPPSATIVVGPGVFTPHQDTAAMIVWCAAALRTVRHPTVVDLCTGSGVIALALALSSPGARIVAVDSAPGAVACARRNADRLATSHPLAVDVRRGDASRADLVSGLLADVAGGVRLVVANPPYLPEGSAGRPPTDDGVDRAALFGGPDGLTITRGIVAAAAGLLAAGGHLAVEHAAGQGPVVVAMVATSGAFEVARDHNDRNGVPRFVTARRMAYS